MIFEAVVALVPMLLVMHFLLDFPLQGDFLSKAKNPTAPIPGVSWRWAMVAHSCIQGGGVALCMYLVTHNIYIAMVFLALEAFAHGLIDMFKCLNLMSFSTDQIAHLVCKLLWITLLIIATGG